MKHTPDTKLIKKRAVLSPGTSEEVKGGEWWACPPPPTPTATGLWTVWWTVWRTPPPHSKPCDKRANTNKVDFLLRFTTPLAQGFLETSNTGLCVLSLKSPRFKDAVRMPFL